MDSMDDYNASSDGFPPRRANRKPESLDSSPPTSSSLSSTSEPPSKLSSSSMSDDDAMMLSRLNISHEEAEEFLKYPMESPHYVPPGIFSNVANQSKHPIGRNYLETYPGLQHYPGKGYFSPPSIPFKRGDNLGTGTVSAHFSDGNHPAPLAEFAYFTERMFETGRRAAPKYSLFNATEEPVGNKHFVFPGDSLPTNAFSTTTSAPRTQIHVFSDRKVHFAEGYVTFVIQVLHPPQDFSMNPRMFQALVTSPKGTTIACRIRSSDSYILNSFLGTFKTEEEAGNYEVNVRMIVPPEKLARFQDVAGLVGGAIHGSTYIAVSKNYGLDSQKECLRIQCEFRLFDPETDTESEAGACGGNVQRDPPTVRGSFCHGTQCKLWGLACDLRNNNLLYTDRESHQVYCASPHGLTVFKFGHDEGIPQSQLLSRPSGVAFDAVHNRILVCDKDNHRVCFFSVDGKFISSFGRRGHKNGYFEYPWDVDVAPSGAIVVTDSKNKRIQLFDPSGNYLCKYTVFEVNPFEYRTQFDYPRGVCFDTAGTCIYVTDFNVNNVVQIPTHFAGHQKLLPAGTVLRPQGITMDATGNLLVADSRHDCLRYMNTRGEHLSTVREVVKEQMVFPVNVTTMAGGFVAVLSGRGHITIF